MTEGEARSPRRQIDQSAARVARAVRQAADDWGARWQPDGRGGRLLLPVSQGLKRGLVVARIEIESTAEGSELNLTVEDEDYRLNRPAVVVLLLGAAGGLVTALWPFFPGLLRLAPVGAVLALVAWLLVVSRLRTTDTDDFLDLVVAGASDAAHAPTHRPG